MAPPIPAHAKRFTANPSRPARYRPGKAVAEVESSEEDAESEEEREAERSSKTQRQAQPRATAPLRSLAQDNDEEDDDDDDEGFVTEDEDNAEGGAPGSTSDTITTTGAKQISSRQTPTHSKDLPSRLNHTNTITAKDDSSDDEDSGEEESEDEDSSSSTEEETPRRKFQRPTFIKKSDRHLPTSKSEANDNQENSIATPAISSSHYDDGIAARRLAETESLIKSTIERDAAARLAGKKSWDDDDDLPPEAFVDDTDGLDPDAEHSAWRLREMHRLKRDREAMIAREKELEEVERRRNMTAAEREAEDRDFIARQKEEKEEQRGKAGFLNKYHHKGAFFLDDEMSERLAKRDLTGAKFADEVADKSTLPEYMRVRDMTKLGKKGRTRYTDLKGQDTGRFGDEVKRWRGSGFESRNSSNMNDLRSLDERFHPDDYRRDRGPRASGANASVVGEKRAPRRRRSSSPSNSDRHRHRRSFSNSRSRSRSRSPPRKPRRQRSPSPYIDRDKRRRIEA